MTAADLVSDSSNPAQWLTVEMIGMQPPYGYVNFKTAAGSVVPVHPPTNPPANPPAFPDCLFNIIYIDMTVPGAKVMHQQLLLARTTGKRISRVIYTVNQIQVSSNPVVMGPQCWMVLTDQRE